MLDRVDDLLQSGYLVLVLWHSGVVHLLRHLRQDFFNSRTLVVTLFDLLICPVTNHLVRAVQVVHHLVEVLAQHHTQTKVTEGFVR